MSVLLPVGRGAVRMSGSAAREQPPSVAAFDDRIMTGGA